MVTRACTRRATTIQIVINALPAEHVSTPSYSVHVGERYLDRLNWDEMLGTIARLTHPKLAGERSYGGPATPEEYQARAEMRAARRRAAGGRS